MKPFLRWPELYMHVGSFKSENLEGGKSEIDLLLFSKDSEGSLQSVLMQLH